MTTDAGVSKWRGFLFLFFQRESIYGNFAKATAWPGVIVDSVRSPPPILSELCVNPLAVISDNRKTPVKVFHLAPIRTQIPGHKGRQRWVFLMRSRFKSICLQSRQSGWLKVCRPCQVYAQHQFALD